MSNSESDDEMTLFDNLVLHSRSGITYRFDKTTIKSKKLNLKTNAILYDKIREKSKLDTIVVMSYGQDDVGFTLDCGKRRILTLKGPLSIKYVTTNKELTVRQF
jgi:hypothetical protein